MCNRQEIPILYLSIHTHYTAAKQTYKDVASFLSLELNIAWIFESTLDLILKSCSIYFQIYCIISWFFSGSYIKFMFSSPLPQGWSECLNVVTVLVSAGMTQGVQNLWLEGPLIPALKHLRVAVPPSGEAQHFSVVLSASHEAAFMSSFNLCVSIPGRRFMISWTVPWKARFSSSVLQVPCDSRRPTHQRHPPVFLFVSAPSPPPPPLGQPQWGGRAGRKDSWAGKPAVCSIFICLWFSPECGLMDAQKDFSLENTVSLWVSMVSLKPKSYTWLLLFLCTLAAAILVFPRMTSAANWMKEGPRHARDARAGTSVDISKWRSSNTWICK